MSLVEAVMPKRTQSHEEFHEPDGSVLKRNLIRLGFSEHVVKTTEIAALVAQKTGKKMSRQRVANLLNAIRITSETIQTIAKGLGVKPEDLMDRKKR
jgi:hypothetical protein